MFMNEKEIVNYIESRPEVLKELLSKCGYVKGKNVKMGDEIYSLSKLYGNDNFITEVLPGIYCECTGTCGNHCTGCKNACYVKKSYDIKPSVVVGHMRRTILMRYFLDEYKTALTGQLARKRKKAEVIRLDQSGEIETLKEFIMHKNIASDHKETSFYIYTKNMDTIGPYILQHANEFPDNFIILISIWNDQNIDWFLRLQHLPFIKAFVVKTGYDYNAAGIHIQTDCKAYNGKKLNKELTCYKCKKCFDHNPNHKIIGCDEH